MKMFSLVLIFILITTAGLAQYESTFEATVFGARTNYTTTAFQMDGNLLSIGAGLGFKYITYYEDIFISKREFVGEVMFYKAGGRKLDEITSESGAMGAEYLRTLELNYIQIPLFYGMGFGNDFRIGLYAGLGPRLLLGAKGFRENLDDPNEEIEMEVVEITSDKIDAPILLRLEVGMRLTDRLSGFANFNFENIRSSTGFKWQEEFGSGRGIGTRLGVGLMYSLSPL